MNNPTSVLRPALVLLSLASALALASGCAPDAGDVAASTGQSLSDCTCDPSTDPRQCTETFDNAPGGSTSFVVPSGCTSVVVKAWGGGGASSPPAPAAVWSTGGGGGYAAGKIPVAPNEVLGLHVAYTWTNWGDATCVTRADGTPLLVAGGGGKSGVSTKETGVNGTMGAAGAGGGEIGQTAANGTMSGSGWSISVNGGAGAIGATGGAGGAATHTGSAGSVTGARGLDHVLGKCFVNGGMSGGFSAGGIGYAGGGAGGTGSWGGILGVEASGGGGSGFVDPSIKATGFWSNVQGNHASAGNAADPDRIRVVDDCDPYNAHDVAHCKLAGEGGASTATQFWGVGGRVVVRWGLPPNASDFPGDPSAPIVSFSAPTYSVAESGVKATITVKRSGGDATRPFDVDYTTRDGSATAGADYTAARGTLSFAANVASHTFIVPVTNDTIAEGAETVSLALSNPTLGATLGANPSALLTITDNDLGGAVAFKTVAYSVKEGDAGPTNVTLTLARTGGTASGASVDFTTVAGTATPDVDFASTSGTVTFAAGATTATFTVPVLGDTLAEGDETFGVQLSNPRGGASLGTATTATVTIKEDEATPVLELDKPLYAVTEGAGTVTVKVVRTGVATGTITVPYATSNGTALAGSDYTTKTGVLTLGPNVLSASIAIPITKDTIDEDLETFGIALSSPAGAVLGTTSSGIVQISDDDVGGVLSFSAAAYSVAESASGATITVKRTAGAASDVTVAYSTSDGTATAPADYTTTTGTLVFAAGATSATFIVPIVNDTTAEGNETLHLVLSNPTGGATLGAITVADLTIKDNESAYSLASDHYAVSEAGGSVTLTVLRTGATSTASSVSYLTVDGTATGGSDYTTKSGLVSFAAGATSATITIPILQDTLKEGNETFEIVIGTNPVPAAPWKTGDIAAAVVTIVDDD